MSEKPAVEPESYDVMRASADKQAFDRARHMLDIEREILNLLEPLDPTARAKVLAAASVMLGIVSPEHVLRKLGG